MNKLHILILVCIGFVHVNAKDDIKTKVTEALQQDDKVKQRVVNVVNEVNNHADKLKSSQRTTGKKHDEVKKVAEQSKKKSNANIDADHAKQTKKVQKKPSSNPDDLEHADKQAQKKPKQQTNDAIKQTDKQSNSLADKFYSILSDVKNSMFETIGATSETADSAGEQVTAKVNEASTKPKKTKKKAKETADL